jgi:hypothetical protein
MRLPGHYSASYKSTRYEHSSSPPTGKYSEWPHLRQIFPCRSPSRAEKIAASCDRISTDSPCRALLRTAICLFRNRPQPADCERQLDPCAASVAGITQKVRNRRTSRCGNATTVHGLRKRNGRRHGDRTAHAGPADESARWQGSSANRSLDCYRLSITQSLTGPFWRTTAKG